MLRGCRRSLRLLRVIRMLLGSRRVLRSLWIARVIRRSRRRRLSLLFAWSRRVGVMLGRASGPRALGAARTMIWLSVVMLGGP
ncbi:hypothetical protein PF005_g13850 [Phytophthora fragariae]|uniref:Uncharacterized protein n=1 Tax=Phytophthora fragariae TaxID=53985 RepID=A0A6A3YY57_9STRA|nr:hypothetical protein PF009_g22559 [Phytophthora fragariae]KAE9070137.1 hypothetical protein PF007_g27053 [Phytophthora fragariae]KAE9135247.1 hypothetical protein PF006_g14648 [Phytophthora fragariae]KAE9204313.1 hypothetical protein PF005_g13850 [Phytophthora fragariae]KAE9225568.1 hypothetical protein PF002_g14368 [Phytophthora fragariae]